MCDQFSNESEQFTLVTVLESEGNDAILGLHCVASSLQATLLSTSYLTG